MLYLPLRKFFKFVLKKRKPASQVSIKKLVSKNVLDQVYPDVQKGGYYIPKDCQTRNKVGILVPYRDRALHLSIFLYNIHPFLMKQKLEYRIFIIEQAGEDLFNRGRLFNAGFLEIMKLGDWKCVIFHDVDLLPLDEEILYTCPIWPRNMCANIVDKTNLPKSRTLFGGVSAIDVKQFKKVNGYSNDYWGWGGEDNDLFRRLQDFGYPVVKYDKKIARYTSLPHLGQSRNKDRFNLLHNAIKRYKHEEFSSSYPALKKSFLVPQDPLFLLNGCN
ncbi:beta-1,4-N-acetylgalactosaminyltransferase bre-4-like [Colias croceus]|uniref:beta-1,4-N-acetylgalactosaminyltransferase bre-4-like n=1 Tax=Colias crocea TaxID=72248 RepID=UPI001E27F0CC|nr:beta-1,4-N-acetylgalactosaminyltransferase bre-4-like [Colias croceus]